MDFLIKKNKCPIETDNWQIELNCYYDNNWLIRDHFAVALERMGSKLNEVTLLKQSNFIFKSLYEDSILNLNGFELDRLKKNIEYIEGKINEEKEN